MAAIDPRLIGGFVHDVSAARALGERAMESLAPVASGARADAALVDRASAYVRTMDTSLTAAEADYPDPFPAAIWRGNVFATQFHPEKSQGVGKLLLKNFAAL